MSVLIKGMEIPKRGMVVCIHADGRVTNHFDEFGKTKGKAVPVPPHGRLIDADALTGSLSTLLRFPSNLVNGQWIVNTIREQPTIIEAEEDER